MEVRKKIADFKRSFSFDINDISPKKITYQFIFLTLIALIVRLIYLSFCTVVNGDAIHYVNIGKMIASGNYGNIDTGWLSIFSFWEALIFLINPSFSAHTVAILSTLIPGVLIIIPVTWIANKLYGFYVGWGVGILCAFQTRLVDFSTNGYSEIFYLFFLTAGIAFLISLVITRKYSLISALLCGLCLGVYFCVRQEGIIQIIALLLFALVWAIRAWGLKNAVRLQRDILLGMCITVGIYTFLTISTVETVGLFQKGIVFNKNYSEQINPIESAREVYGPQSILLEENRIEVPFFQKLEIFAKRYPLNILYTIKRLPKILLSPIFLFAILVPFLIRRRPLSVATIPLSIMLLFPLAFYPILQVEPRYLFGILIPIQIFGCAGLYALSRFVFDKRYQWIFWGMIAAICVFSMVVNIYRAISLEKENHVHIELANWIKEKVPSSEPIVGDGYGNITQTAFLAGHQNIYPTLWTENPDELIQYMHEKNARWLVIYENYAETMNPSMISVFDNGYLGFKKEYEVRDSNGKRYQILKLKES